MRMLFILCCMFFGVQLLTAVLGVTGVSVVAFGFLVVCLVLLFRAFWRA